MRTIYRAFLFLLSFGCTLASDFNPPEWRGMPGSTYQKWNFSTSNMLPVADDYNNSYGTPCVTQVINGNWYDQLYDRQGMWYSETINFLVPNDTETLNDTKYQIQIIWAAPTVAVTNMSLFIHDSLDAVPVVQADIVDQYYNLSWYFTTFEATVASFGSAPIVYCETRSSGYLQAAYVDEIVIDTIIIPEPATMFLLCLGGLLIRRKKYNRI